MKRLMLILILVTAFAAQDADAQGRRRPAAGGREDSTIGFKGNPQMLAAFKSVVATPSKSVLRVQCDGKDAALGTIVSADGYVLTKQSELAEGAEITCVLPADRKLVARVVGVDTKADLAMLKIDAKGLTPIVWANSKSAAVGDLLASPGTGGEAVAVGVLSVAARNVKPRDLPPSTPPANSGFLGVGLEEAEGGARIMQILPNSAAQKSGLRVDDIVTLIADTLIIDSETMINTIQHHKPGDTVKIKIKRGEKELEFQVALGARPPEDPRLARRDFQNNMGSELSKRRGGFPAILQHDMVIRPGDCGGPVVDLDGKAVGINIARAGRVESYAIPAETIQALIPTLKGEKLATTQPTDRAAR